MNKKKLNPRVGLKAQYSFKEKRGNGVRTGVCVIVDITPVNVKFIDCISDIEFIRRADEVTFTAVVD
jgi:hypothetical protein